MEQKVSEVEASISSVSGFKVAGVHCGLKDNGALDFALIVSDRPCTAAAVFTTNQVKSAHVLVDMEKLKRNSTSIRAVAINTRCANACTGQQGIDNAYETARWIAEKIGCGEDEVLVMSTGVIGTQLPMDKIKRGVELSVAALGENNWDAAARAIMTTDTRPKLASTTIRTANGHDGHVAGIAKGSGMIAPNMATMLSTIVTDTIVNGHEMAHSIIAEPVKSTFNRIAVDGDMSTNDTVLFLANGASNLEANGVDIDYYVGLTCGQLARDIVRDGEGATKFISLLVTGASDAESAYKIANTIATSPLVKTAFYGGDANWGRIIAAAGRAGVALDPNKMKLWFAAGEVPERDLLLFENGMPANYSENDAAAIMQQPSIAVTLDCGAGTGTANIWTCDLSHDYVSINGHYRT